MGVLRSLGLATMIDLRTARELGRTGRGPLAEEPIAYRHLSVIQEGEGEALAAPAPPGEELGERYLWYLDGGRSALVDALALVSEPDSLPLVFHCAAGKDRTGVLAALILDIVGVDPEVIVADYLITAGRMELILGRYRDDPAFAPTDGQGARLPVRCRGAVHGAVPRRLHDGFGGARAWAVDAGLAPGALDRMEDLLVEPVD